jgi:acrylyl-CoA reductase (NADPH)
MVRAVLVRELDGQVGAAVEDVSEELLGDDPVRVKVQYSTLNYKDAMVLRGLGKLVRSYPHVPGIDLAGEVVEDATGTFEPGTPVVVTGFHVGERHAGGLCEEAHVRPEWVVPLPGDLGLRDAMAVGTAGLTAMLALRSIEEQARSDRSRPLLVTGAAGGVGSLAVAFAAARGWKVAASTGRPQERAYLERLGASEIIERSELSRNPRPLESERFSAVIDAVGGQTFATALAQLGHGGVLASVGLAAGHAFCGSVMPFLLRGVRVIGIDSTLAPLEDRRLAWEAIARDLDRELLASVTSEVGLNEVPALADEILQGKVRGRIVVAVGR